MKKPLKVFLSQPMHGRTEEEVKERRKILKAAAAVYYYETYGKYPDEDEIKFISVFDDEYNTNLKQEDITAKNPRIFRLGHALEELADADLVIFDNDYNVAPGCLVEMAACVAYRINYHFVDEYIGKIEFEATNKDKEYPSFIRDFLAHH